jgi:hypothetical protein
MTAYLIIFAFILIGILVVINDIRVIIKKRIDDYYNEPEPPFDSIYSITADQLVVDETLYFRTFFSEDQLVWILNQMNKEERKRLPYIDEYDTVKWLREGWKS